MSNWQIREARIDDTSGIREVYHSAFPAEEWELVATLAEQLLADGAKAWVIEENGVIHAHVAFSRVSLDGDPQAWILAPLAVLRNSQGKKLGTKLVTDALEILKAEGMALCFVYGDPKLYERFGFSVELADGFEAPHPLEFPFGWQVMVCQGERSDYANARLSCVSALDSPELW